MVIEGRASQDGFRQCGAWKMSGGRPAQATEERRGQKK